jgi:branched-chain amino acid transport system substrate-binding protein
MKRIITFLTMITLLLAFAVPVFGDGTVKVGLNYPKTGPYAAEGLDQWRAAQMALEEINAQGGILGKKIEIIWRDSQSKADVTRQNVNDLIDKEGVKMVFGGSSSGVAVAAGEICQNKGIPFFGTLTYSTATTGTEGHRHTFRECYDSWMAAKAISMYLKMNYPNKKYFYITANYTWGWTTEESVRKLTGTQDKSMHKSVLTPFPGATEADFEKALNAAKTENPDVLVLVLFGYDMSKTITMATQRGMKNTAQIVVPNLTLGMAEAAGPEAMEGVIGALPWCWQVPYKYDYARGKKFVEDFINRHNRYPSTSGASAYTILYEYKAAVERAGTFNSEPIVKTLEGHTYQLLKGEQIWRDFDHQSVQAVYAVKGKPAAEVRKDKFQLDYFDIISSILGSRAVITKAEWNEQRKAANKPPYLERFPGEEISLR